MVVPTFFTVEENLYLRFYGDGFVIFLVQEITGIQWFAIIRVKCLVLIVSISCYGSSILPSLFLSFSGLDDVVNACIENYSVF